MPISVYPTELILYSIKKPHSEKSTVRLRPTFLVSVAVSTELESALSERGGRTHVQASKMYYQPQPLEPYPMNPGLSNRFLYFFLLCRV